MLLPDVLRLLAAVDERPMIFGTGIQILQLYIGLFIVPTASGAKMWRLVLLKAFPPPAAGTETWHRSLAGAPLP